MEPFCLKGAQEICEAVGENPKCIHELVRDHGLPAWKRGPGGSWRALHEDLRKWIQDQRDRNIGFYVYARGIKDSAGPSGGNL
ncbi:helix-turn-helix domain-containing protein [Pseudodesulfovibrio sp. zrk46]|uniref:helix-turn-helix domain-containing protein n=1 Tax=Pseudodesulfovibrio sp. zrk46 TaxID=2725288 RepID=UPI0014494F3A|nr:helix-turn-helix domain-containing protein [Pseudodesulfovibrio sp. zrk46]QJB56164.1 helix-turn-helix domain-containing protein [Pseudodesulfovibrio sp. zrk46]